MSAITLLCVCVCVRERERERDENSAEEYQKAISSQKIQALTDNFLNNSYTRTNEGVNLAVRDINYILKNQQNNPN